MSTTPTLTPDQLWTPAECPKPSTLTPPAGWQLVDASSFSLYTPPGWSLHRLVGIDSYVGEVVGGDARLVFDLGWYSNPLALGNDPTHTVTCELIDGYKAKIVVPKVTAHGMTGVYFGELWRDVSAGPLFPWMKFNLVGRNLTREEEDTALRIFRTIRFKKSGQAPALSTP